MPAFGGYALSPTQDGGEKPRALVLHEALNAARGTALDCSEGTITWVENLAIARALAEVWDANECLANQFDMLRVTALLSRWERIFGLVSGPDITEADRRARCAEAMAKFGLAPWRQRVLDALNAALDPVTATVEYTTPSTSGAFIRWPGGTPSAENPWCSTVLYLAFLVTKPDWMSEGDFYERVGAAMDALRDWLPAWVTFDWIRDGSSEGEFILDEDANLDNQRMSVS